LYISLDKGISWQLFNKNLPNVAIHDLVIQPEEKDLIIATHGRSLYKTDIAPIQEFLTKGKDKKEQLFTIKSIKKTPSWGNSWSKWFEPNIPEVKISFYVDNAQKVTLNFYLNDEKVNSLIIDAEKGFNESVFDVSFNEEGLNKYRESNKEEVLKEAKNGKTYLPKGKYTVKLNKESETFEIK